MSDKAPATKLTIEIADIGDRRACVEAVRKLHSAIKEHYGEKDAWRIFVLDREGPPPDQRERSRLRAACMSFDSNDLRLILKYYAMPKPNKEKLARDLAKKNESLPEEERYPVKSAEDPAGAILQQIKRAFRFDKEACRIIGGAPEYLRREKLAEVEETRRRPWKFKMPRTRFITIRQRFGGHAEHTWVFDKRA